MERTVIKELVCPKLKNPVLIKGFPGLGEIGRIAVRFLIEELKAEKMAELYSPYFPHYVLVDENGVARLLSGQFFYWKNQNGKHDLILVTGDVQAQTTDGQYEVTSRIIDYVSKFKVAIAIALGGYRAIDQKNPNVVVVATEPELAELAQSAGAEQSPEGNPIVGMAGLLIGLAKLKGLRAMCLLAKTKGYMPDPEAAKQILTVLTEMLELRVDLSKIDEEIQRVKDAMEKMKQIEERREHYLYEMERGRRDRMTYIS